MNPLTEDIERIAHAAAGAAEEPDLSHDALALRLGKQWQDSVRYVDKFKRFYIYDGNTWHEDERLEHLTQTRAFLRDTAGTLNSNQAKELKRADTVAKIASLARSNPEQASRVDQWDRDDWLLGTPDGVVDLRTGNLRSGRPEDYITKTTACAPAPPGTPAPLWTEFLNRITDGNTELQKYEQRFFGYALTGSIQEHAFVFGDGSGANGKGVKCNTIKGAFGDYAISIPTEMLMVSRNDRHPTELARLRGIRLAFGSETQDGRRWDEAKLKGLTGGDPIPARFMRGDYFEFSPTFKLFIIGNHRPSIRGVDEAMRRRLHLIPFTVTIPDEEQDQELEEKLKAEWPAILRWCIDGCLDWQCQKLNPPESVTAATTNYLDAEDAVSLWIEECCTEDSRAWKSSKSLFASWKGWADRAEEFVGSQKRFSGVLQDRGYHPHRQSSLRGF